MNTVIIVNLNGRAFHLEEPGFLALRTYLERAQTQLKDNPDRTEIIADLQQAIADKCAQFLSPHKNVLSAAEIAQVLQQMGPVESDAAAETGAAAANSARRNLLPPQESARQMPRYSTSYHSPRGRARRRTRR